MKWGAPIQGPSNNFVLEDRNKIIFFGGTKVKIICVKIVEIEFLMFKVTQNAIFMHIIKKLQRIILNN